jgi:hypothetical protein
MLGSGRTRSAQGAGRTQALGTGVGSGGSVGRGGIVTSGVGATLAGAVGTEPGAVRVGDGVEVGVEGFEGPPPTLSVELGVLVILGDGAPPGWLGSTSGTSRMMGEGTGGGGRAISVALTSSIEVPKVSSNGISARVAAVASQAVMEARSERCSG